MSPVPPAVELLGVHASYGRVPVLTDVDLVVPPASVVVLLGANGAGKSTALALVDGRVRPTSGCVHLGDRHVNDMPADARARAGLCSVPERRGVFANLSVAENLWLATTARPSVTREHAEGQAFTRFPALADRRAQRAGSLSGGEQQMLALARALVTDPAVLVVDELSLGLAPRLVTELYEVIRQLAAEGRAVLLAEQSAHVARDLADFVVVMARGRALRVGEPADVDDLLADAYFGVTA